MVLAMFGIAMQAQPTLTDVINSFNAGAQEVNSGNFTKAILKFEETIKLAEELGPEGDKMKADAQSQIPALHYRMALDAYKAKDIEGSIAQFEKALATSEKYGNEEVHDKSVKYIPQLYYALGSSQIRVGELDSALASFDKALGTDPSYARAVYGKAMVYKLKDDDAKLVATMEQAIKAGKATGDEKTAAAATKTLKDYYMNAAKVAFKNEAYDKALQDIEASNKYDSTDAESYYLRCVIYDKQEAFDKAVESGLKALQYEKPDDQAKIWFELGNAYTNLVEYDKACDAYSKAMVDPYLETAKYKMENVLHCK